MTPDYSVRLTKVRERMRLAGLDVLLISEPNNIFYLCGSNGGYTGAKIRLIVDMERSVLVIDQRYLDEARQNAYADNIVAWVSPSYDDVLGVVRETATKNHAVSDVTSDVSEKDGAGEKPDLLAIGFEATQITLKQYERLLKEFEGFKLVGSTGVVEPVREIKDAIEIERIGAAAAIADKAFMHILDFVKPGITEIEIEIELDYFMRRNGAEKVSFDTIVASGPNSAVPHATPSTRAVQAGDFVKIDFGAVVDGYHSDMTRTVVVGKAGDRQREIYEAVLSAQMAALESVAPGVACGDIDAIAREIIAARGFGDCFVHNLGHGVGIQIHEMPTLGKGSETVLSPGMVVTVEPGVYVSGFGGVRIEDLVVVTETGHLLLSHSTKDLLEL